MAVVDLVVLVPFIGGERELIGAALDDDLHQVADIETTLDEFVGQVLQQFRIARRIAGADVIQRLNDTGSGQVAPDAIGIAHGKVIIVGTGHPGGELLATAGRGFTHQFGIERHLWSDRRVGAQVILLPFFFVGNNFIQRLCALDGTAADGLAGAGWIGLEIDLGKVSGGLVILVPGPFFKGMVVAFVAVETRGQKQVRRVFRQFLRRAHSFEIRGCRIVLGRTGGGDDPVGHAVIGCVVCNLLPDPGAQRRHAFTAEEFAVHLQHVSPFVRPMIDEVGVSDELVDHLVALGSHVAFVGDEGAHFFSLWRQAGEVEMNAAQEILIAADTAWLDLHALPFAGDEFVDFAPLLRLLPGKPGAVTHHRDGGRGIRALKAGQNGGFTAAQAGHEAGFVSLDHVHVAAVHKGFSGDVTDITIRVVGHDTDLLAVADAFQHWIFWRHFDACDTRCLHVQLGPLADPGFQRLVIKLARHGELAALVRHGTTGLEQHEGVLG